MKRPAIIIDLDGTLYDAKWRQEKFLLSGKKDFNAFHAHAKFDAPNLWCLLLVQKFQHTGYTILFVSGRDDTYREETETWLTNHLGKWGNDYKLIMRPAGDYTEDAVLKKDFYYEFIEPFFSVLFCVDDRKRVVDMWRSIGLTCLQCQEGNF